MSRYQSLDLIALSIKYYIIRPVRYYCFNSAAKVLAETSVTNCNRPEAVFTHVLRNLSLSIKALVANVSIVSEVRGSTVFPMLAILFDDSMDRVT